MIGGTLMQTIILVIVTIRTDWDKEVFKKIIFYNEKILGRYLGMILD